MTEEEAKLKRCGGPPGCGTLQDPHGIVNFAGDPVNAPRWCIGSDCMLWVDETTVWTDVYGDVKKGDKSGCCGLGGKP